MPRSPSESCEVVRATGRIIEISEETRTELQKMGMEEEVTKLTSPVTEDGRLDMMGNDAAIRTYKTMWFTDHPAERRADSADDGVHSCDATESASDTTRENCDNTLYVMLQTDEPCAVRGKKMKVYLRLSLNGIKQYDIPAKQIEGLNGNFFFIYSICHSHCVHPRGCTCPCLKSSHSC